MPVDLAGIQLGRKYTRPQLADMWGYGGYQAIAKGVVTPANSGLILLFVTREKQEALTQYDDFISGDYLHWEGEKKHGADERIAEAHRTGEEVHLFYRDIHHSPFQYRGRVELIHYSKRDDKPSEFKFRLEHDLGPTDDVATHAAELEQLPETEKQLVVKARVGQGKFREELFNVWRGCAVTGISLADLLRASHIKPWRDSNNSERLDRFNGLLLLPHYDHLFDRGFITFNGRGHLEISPAIERLDFTRLGISKHARLKKIDSEHRPFLEYHHREVFVDQSGRDT